MTWFKRADPERESACSCHLPAGAWGDGGWHHARHTAVSLAALREKETERILAMQSGLHGALQELGIGAGPRAVSDRRAAAEMAAVLIPDTLLGTVYTFERCPAHRAACERKLADKKTTTAKRKAREAD